MHTRTLRRQGPFSLAAAADFLKGFTPARYRGGRRADTTVIRLAFPVENTEDVAISSITQHDDGSVVARIDGADPDLVAHQLERILSLDVDGRGFAAAGRRDPMLGTMIDRYDALRPVCFQSVYEAACWAVIGHRVRMTQAAAIKERISEVFGERLSIDGVSLAAFPTPSVLAKIADDLPLPEVKRDRLHGLALATLDGRLDADHLRSLEAEVAMEELKTLAGIGPFSAELILIRGCGAPDVFPASERRLLAGMREIYEMPGASYAELSRIAEAWRPYRSWASVLVRTSGADRSRSDTRSDLAIRR
jgi:DNA-3-methyladenine glycosylase II